MAAPGHILGFQGSPEGIQIHHTGALQKGQQRAFRRGNERIKAFFLLAQIGEGQGRNCKGKEAGRHFTRGAQQLAVHSRMAEFERRLERRVQSVMGGNAGDRLPKNGIHTRRRRLRHIQAPEGITAQQRGHRLMQGIAAEGA